jgi:DNA-binding LacI/PurR family transcriptional regulator
MPNDAQHPAPAAVTLRDICRACGLDVSTVSRALRGDRGRVSAATIAQVQAVAQAMGYNPAQAHAARRLASRKSGQRLRNHAVALLMPRGFSTKAYFFTLFHALMDVFSAEGYGVFTFYPEAEDTDIHPVLARGEVDGLLAAGIPDAYLHYCRCPPDGAPALPLVSMIHARPEASAVVADDEGGGYLLGTHLLEMGHRHLLHCYNDAEAPAGLSARRLAGVHRAYQERGLAPATFLHYCPWHPYGQDPDSVAWVWEALRQGLAIAPQVTGILAPNDFVAGQFHAALRAHGVRVPDDLSLVGFDDILPVVDATGANLLTTIRVPLREIGLAAARLMLAQVAELAAPHSRVVPVELVVRASVRRLGAPV